VWAPDARVVELVLGGGAVPMDADERGWWRTTVDDAPAGTRYAFTVDGGPPRPDPRSTWQPDGVEGTSAVVDHDAFPWSDLGWRGVPLRGAVLYELHIGTFSPEGTFDGAIERLDHVVALGVDAVEVMPVAEFPGTRGWGYDGVDLFAPHHAYGGPDGCKRFVDACHARNLGVVLDVVYNHVGPSGNYLAEFGPYFSDRHRTNWGQAVNFDGPGSDEVRRLVVDNARMWLEQYHMDGLRLDAVHAIVDQSARHILRELSDEIDACATRVGRPLFLVAESDRNDPRVVRSPDAGGLGMDAAWADEWHHALHATLTGERDGYYEEFGSLPCLAKALRQAWVFDGQWSAHRRRHHGAPPTGLRGHQFVVCTQNHDQVGNRALGERSSVLLSDGRLRVAAALLCSSPFVPMLFAGEEWGASTPFEYFTDHHDPGLGEAVSKGRRQEFAAFGWDPASVPDPQDPATFARSKLDWDEPARAGHAALLDWYRRLIALRREVPALADPRLSTIDVRMDEQASTLVVRREGGVSVAVNLGDDGAVVLFCDLFAADDGCEGATRAQAVLLAASDPAVELRGDGVTVPPDAAVVLRRR